MKALYEYQNLAVPGTINAGGVMRNLIGSDLSPTEIFLREAVQNAYDARLSTIDVNKKTKQYKTLEFGMRAYRFTDDQLSNLDMMLDGEFYSKNIKKKINIKMLNIEVSDSNTTGLIGNTSPCAQADMQNFSNFVYLTGQTKDSTAGGSFGYGKAAFFSYSTVRTIVVYSRVSLGNNVFQTRFIVITTDERITTSHDRCWWGQKKEYGGVDNGSYAAPLLDSDADEYASALGISLFKEKETGTRILVLAVGLDHIPADPYNNPRTIEDVFREDLPCYIVHWYWNKIDLDKIHFHIQFQDENIQVDDPEEVFPYNEFCRSYRAYVSYKTKQEKTTGIKVSEIQQTRPKLTLGSVSLCPTDYQHFKYEFVIPMFNTAEPVVARMRSIGLIVNYQQQSFETNQIQKTCYGVFVTNADKKEKIYVGDTEIPVDEYFRQVENQTHDKWVHRSGSFKYDFVKTVDQGISDYVKNCVVIEPAPLKANNISVVIQRILGEKLMAYSANIGGPGVVLPPKATTASDSSPKSVIRPTGTTRFYLDPEKGKIAKVEFKASVRQGKQIVIQSIRVGVQTIDSSDGLVYDNSYVSFYQLEIPDKNNTGRTLFPSPPFKLSRSGTVFINILCKKDCIFNIEINSEEKDA